MRRSAPISKRFDYLPKPFDIDEAVALVDRAISHYREQQQPRNAPIISPTADIIGEAPAMQDVFRIIGRLSRSSISVLINGESGTGKSWLPMLCIATARAPRRRLLR